MQNASLRFSSPVLLTALAPGLGDGPARADAPGALVGCWLGQLGGSELALELGADGVFTMGAVEGGWSAASGELLLDGEPLRYRLEGASLLLTDPTGRTVRWRRVVTGR